ncbi:MAG: arylesterase [Gammaproteobacteria bacterium]
MRWFKRKFLYCIISLTVPAACPACPVLVIGDSISAAHGLQRAEGWVALLQQKLDQENIACTVINSSIDGDTSAGGLQRIDQELSAHRPRIVVIELGGNDGLRGLPPGVLEANLKEMIRRVQTSGARVILLGIQIPPNYGKSYTALFEGVYDRLAADRSVRFVPKLLSGIGDHAEYMQSDGIHPNSDAQPLIRDEVWKILKNLLPDRSEK